MATALRWASRSLNTPSKFASIKLLMVSVMVNPPSIHSYREAVRVTRAGEQAERLVQPNVVDGVPMFGGDAFLDAQEVGRGEVDGLAASGAGGVPDALRCGGGVVGRHGRVQRQPAGQRAAADRPTIAEVGTTVGGPAGVLDVSSRGSSSVGVGSEPSWSANPQIGAGGSWPPGPPTAK